MSIKSDDTLHELTELQNNEIQSEAQYDSSENEQEDMVRVVTSTTKYVHSKWTKCVLIAFTILIILVAVILLNMYLNSSSTGSESDAPNEMEKYVLPNTTVVVLFDTNTSISGEFTVDDRGYEFASVSDETEEFISFINIDENKVAGWVGFELNHANYSKLQFKLYHSQVGIHIIQIDNNVLNQNETILMESFLDDSLCEHYVELSVKLGGFGYLGLKSHSIENLHSFAQWIWKYETETDEADNIVLKSDQWVDITEEFEKVNAINSASKNAGFWVSNMNELMVYTSDEYTPNKHERSLLGNCGSPFYRCDNSCFGMCGPKCTCWSWRCGDCDCWWGCYDHDAECCNGMSTYCCVNVFWIKCDGSGWCQ